MVSLTKETCTERGCHRPSIARGYCTLHYQRHRKAGTFECLNRAARKSGIAFLMEHIHHAGDGCLIWPFSQNHQGRGRVMVDGKTFFASRMMCILAHGEPPFEGAEAAHSCGKGHLGCVHPKHLRWATKIENTRDKIGHGTLVHGEAASYAKLSSQQVLDIYRDQRCQRVVAEEYNITQTMVSRIKLGKAWRRITGHPAK